MERPVRTQNVPARRASWRQGHHLPPPDPARADPVCSRGPDLLHQHPGQRDRPRGCPALLHRLAPPTANRTYRTSPRCGPLASAGSPCYRGETVTLRFWPEPTTTARPTSYVSHGSRRPPWAVRTPAMTPSPRTASRAIAGAALTCVAALVTACGTSASPSAAPATTPTTASASATATAQSRPAAATPRPAGA